MRSPWSILVATFYRYFGTHCGITDLLQNITGMRICRGNICHLSQCREQICCFYSITGSERSCLSTRIVLKIGPPGNPIAAMVLDADPYAVHISPKIIIWVSAPWSSPIPMNPPQEQIDETRSTFRILSESGDTTVYQSLLTW